MWHILSGDSIVQVGQGAVSGRLVDPSRQVVEEGAACVSGGDGRRETFPVALCPGVTGVEGNAVLVRHGGVEVALHLIDRLWHEAQTQLGVGKEVVKKTCGIGEPCLENVTGMRLTMTGGVSIGKCGMRWVGVLGNGQVLPLGNVVVSNAGEVGCIVAVAGQVGNDGHGLNTDHALQGQVGLVANHAGQSVDRRKIDSLYSRQRPSEIVRRDLVGWIERVVHEVVRPLPENIVVGVQVVGVASLQCIGQGHDNHVAALLQRHFLVIPVIVTRGIGVPGAEVVHGIRVGVLARLLVLVQRLHDQSQDFRVGVQEDGVGWEDDVHGVHVTVRGDLLQEQVHFVFRAAQLRSTKCLSGRERGQHEVVIAADCAGVLRNPAIERAAKRAGLLEIMVEEGESGQLSVKVALP